MKKSIQFWIRSEKYEKSIASHCKPLAVVNIWVKGINAFFLVWFLVWLPIPALRYFYPQDKESFGTWCFPVMIVYLYSNLEYFFLEAEQIGSLESNHCMALSPVPK